MRKIRNQALYKVINTQTGEIKACYARYGSEVRCSLLRTQHKEQNEDEFPPSYVHQKRAIPDLSSHIAPKHPNHC